MQRIARAWSAYWLAPGGRYATAAMRIAIASSVLWMLYRFGGTVTMESTRFYRHGITYLLPTRPDAAVVDVLTVTAWVSTVSFLVGFQTRVAQIVSVVSTLSLAALGVSDAATWSHKDVPPMLAQVAFLGARAGDTWAIDAWLRRRRGDVPPPPTQTSARLTLVTVASIFVVSGYWKLRTGGFELGWVLSDNMRHQLLVRYDWLRLPRPPLANWIMQDVWRYRLVALGNFISQLAPAAAPFLVHWPKLRSTLALVFVLEILGLGYVMNLWNEHWLPLAAVFIDWDALVAWVQRKHGHAAEPLGSPRRAPLHLAYVTVFVVFYGVQAFWLNQRLGVYPFSSFPLFAEVRSKQPYLTHQSYEMLGGHIEAFGNRPLTQWEHTWLAMLNRYRWMWRARDVATVRRHLQTILGEVRELWPDLEIQRVRITLAVFQAPAYPAPPRLDRHDVAVLGELSIDGTFRSALGALGPDGTIVSPRPGFTPVSAAVLADLAAPLVPVAAIATPVGLRLAAPLAGDTAYLVTTDTDGTPWLAGFNSPRAF